MVWNNNGAGSAGSPLDRPRTPDELPRFARDTTPENPWPVSLLSQHFHDAVERWPAAWIEGQIIETLLAYRTTEVDGEYNETTQYFTADDTPITAEEYQAIHENGTFGGDVYQFMVDWTILYADDIEQMDEYEWQAVLTELWDVNEAGGGPF